jgi:teichoic acid transport system ATP-binding protein
MAANDIEPPSLAVDAPVAISVQDLHVSYRVYEEQRLSARELLGRGFRRRRHSTVHAVRGVTFDIRAGEAVGIVGSNGSGKSTLLQTVAGLQARESGRVLVRAEPHLLGVNAALKPNLSGYRNVMLGGLAIGMTRAEIEDRFSEVEEFSGLGDAMARPLRTFSSGMRARLAFSIATLRTPEILLIDEALAVGDRDFRKRSLERVRKIRDDAGTVMMVTHNLNEVRNTCRRVIWLDHGTIRADGPTEAVLEIYESGDDGA